MPSTAALRSEIRNETIPALLRLIRSRFYSDRPPADFHRDHNRLLYALTWPASWLERRHLHCRQERFGRLLTERLDAIQRHGDPARFGPYFPNYLLKCLQDWFAHHGNELDSELRHVGNALHFALNALPWAEKDQIDTRQIEVFAATHRLLHARFQRKSAEKKLTCEQLSLF